MLRGFDETDILPFGGMLEPLRVDAGAQVLATFVPAFPIYPPETAWMREPKTDMPGLILNTTAGGGRIAFLPADLDRRFARDNLPDHGDLLANLVRWAARDDIPLARRRPRPDRLPSLPAAGPADPAPGQPDQRGDLAPARGRTDSRRSAAGPGQAARRTFAASARDSSSSGKAVTAGTTAGWSRFEVTSILDHEVIVIS